MFVDDYIALRSTEVGHIFSAHGSTSRITDSWPRKTFSSPHHRSQGLLNEEQEGAVAMVWWPGGYDKVALRGWEVELVEVALARCA